MVVKKNDEHIKMVLRNRRLIQSYNKALRDGNNECLGQVKRQLEFEIMQQEGSRNVRFLQLVLENVNRKLSVA